MHLAVTPILLPLVGFSRADTRTDVHRRDNIKDWHHFRRTVQLYRSALSVPVKSQGLGTFGSDKCGYLEPGNFIAGNPGLL